MGIKHLGGRSGDFTPNTSVLIHQFTTHVWRNATIEARPTVGYVSEVCDPGTPRVSRL